MDITEYKCEVCRHKHKAIEKAPILEGDVYFEDEMIYDTWKCPECSMEYVLDDESKHNYCPHCGQKIRWSKENE